MKSIRGWVLAVNNEENNKKAAAAIGKSNGKVSIVNFPKTMKMVEGDYVVLSDDETSIEFSSYPLIKKVVDGKSSV